MTAAPSSYVETFLQIAYARSCRPAWEAARYGDHDPQVLEQARIYTDWIGDPA